MSEETGKPEKIEKGYKRIKITLPSGSKNAYLHTAEGRLKNGSVVDVLTAEAELYISNGCATELGADVAPTSEAVEPRYGEADPGAEA